MYQTKNRAFKQLSMKKLFLNIIEIKNAVAKDKLATKYYEKVNKLRSSKNMNNSEKDIFGLLSE